MPVNGLEGTSQYAELFTPEKIAEQIRRSAFPIAKRAPAQACTGSPWLQKGSRSPVIEHGEEDEIWERAGSLTEEQIAYYSTPEGIVALNREGIDLAVERRAALFFHQAILCYRMPFVFSSRGADDQIGTAPALRLSGGKKSTVHKREAAHSSTLPTLIAKEKGGGREFVYLKGGSSHFQHNATIGMHRDVNGADELLDGKGQDERLRDTSLKILNRVAEGLDPVRATREFLKSFESQADQSSKDLQSADVRKAVLHAYQQRVSEIQTCANDVLFDRLLGVVIDADDPKEKILRNLIYRKRYDIIRLQEAVESRIGKRIAETQEKMGSRDRALLEFALLKEFAETPERKILEKLFAKTAAVFEEQYVLQGSNRQKSSLKSFQTRVRTIQEKYPKLLAVLKRDLRADFRELSSAELAYRAQVFKELRTRVRNWTQIEFCNRYYESTQFKVSQSWVSRMEQPSRGDRKIYYKTPLNQRCRFMTLADVERCSATFGVDPGLLLPCLVTSEN